MRFLVFGISVRSANSIAAVACSMMYWAICISSHSQGSLLVLASRDTRTSAEAFCKYKKSEFVRAVANVKLSKLE